MRRYPQFTQAPERVTTFDSEGVVAETVVRRRYMQFSEAPSRVEDLWSLGSADASGFVAAWAVGLNIVMQPGQR